MVGNWEALIKSIKRTLKAIACDCLFTEDTLHTFICEVESILNNQPITPSSDDINDYKALTPNHILLGHSLTNHAPCAFRDNKINYRKNSVQFKQQPTCFGVAGSRNIYQRSFRDGNRIIQHKT